MILVLSAIGVLGEYQGGELPEENIVTPAARTIVLKDSGRGTPVKNWTESMDPYDIVDYKIDATGLLEVGENIASYTVLPRADSELMGLRVADNGYQTRIVDNVITLWLSIIPARQGDTLFTVGTTLPVELSFTTDSVPSRRKQRTCLISVIQR